MQKPSLSAQQQHQLLPTLPESSGVAQVHVGAAQGLEGAFLTARLICKQLSLPTSTGMWRCSFIFSWIFFFFPQKGW